MSCVRADPVGEVPGDNAAAGAAALSEDDKARIRALAADFPALWADPATPQRERSAWPGCSSTMSP